MKKIIFSVVLAVLGIAVANAQDPCNVPVDLEVTNVTANTASISWSGGDAPVAADFPGDWNLTFAEGDEMHMTLTLDAMLHMYLASQGQDMDDIDTTISASGMPVFVTIEQASGDQYTVSGSFDMEFGMGDPIQFHFNTTGTLTSSGLSIEPAAINESITLMDALPLEFTGTVTFVQPTTLPVEGVLTLEIASLDIDGNGSISGMPNMILITLDGTQLHPAGMQAIPGVEGYELLRTEVATGEQTTVSTSYTHYLFYDLESETDYTVAVRTLCTGNTYSEWSDPVPFTTLDGSDFSDYCDAPINVVVEQSTENDIINAHITWEGTSNEYDIELRTDGQQPFRETISYIGYDFVGEPSTTYTVRVRQRCDGGFTSEWTEAVSFTTPAAPQQGINSVASNSSEQCTIYPNPATSHTTVSIDSFSGKAQVSVIDMSGRTVTTTTMNGGTAQINVAKLAKGTYFVRISGEQISAVRKLIVK